VRLFWNAHEHRLRAGWRIALQLLLATILGALPIVLIAEPLTALHRSGLFLPLLDHDHYDRVINRIVGPLLTCGVVASVLIAARWLDRRPLSHYGVVLDAMWWKCLVLGFAISGAVMVMIFGFEYATGAIVATAGTTAISYSIVKVLCVGVYEEFVTRGYLLRNLADGISLKAAIVISSLVFAALHFANENASAMSMIGLVVNALFFVSAALLTRRLSAAIGAHIGWNLFEGAILGFPVSGDKEAASLIHIRQFGNAIVTGGDFGPEAGLVGVAASLVGVAALFVLTRSRLPRTGAATVSSAGSPPR
jgi:membrane protease YdiL (CAAX protease family)